ncbi:copper transporter [Skermania piniformis]|uniref:Copper transporter n=1 Tax=Skermania pinensis TaxID=39122 RepID=A0ABX8S3V7_9ACTN|nr:copper transporter [Skermania piniformis]QXQ12518.1 copper transporter [Skermania piniformis]
MISLRQHAVSIAAIFLALAVGMVLGSQTLASGLLSGLRDDKSDLQHQVDDLQGTNNQLTHDLAAADEFNAATGGRVLHDALANRTVVVFSTPDADPGDVEGVTRAIVAAGGTSTGRVALTQAFVDPAEADRLRTAVTNVVPAGVQLRTGAIDQGSLSGDLLGAVLLLPDGQPPLPDPDRDLVLNTMSSGGFITFPDGPARPAQLAVVITGGATAPDSAGTADGSAADGNVGAVVARFAAALDGRGLGSVLAGRLGSALGSGPIAMVRADSALTAATSTVDDVNRAAGRISTVLALQEQATGGSGRYGTGPKATAVTVGAAPAGGQPPA